MRRGDSPSAKVLGVVSGRTGQEITCGANRMVDCRLADIYCPMKHQGHCPGKGMIKTNILGSLFGQGAINNCHKVCHHGSVVFKSETFGHCGFSPHAACTKEI